MIRKNYIDVVLDIIDVQLLSKLVVYSTWKGGGHDSHPGPGFSSHPLLFWIKSIMHLVVLPENPSCIYHKVILHPLLITADTQFWYLRVSVQKISHFQQPYFSLIYICIIITKFLLTSFLSCLFFRVYVFSFQITNSYSCFITSRRYLILFQMNFRYDFWDNSWQ